MNNPLAPQRRSVCLLLLMAATGFMPGRAANPPETSSAKTEISSPTASTGETAEQKLGIQVSSVFLSGGGNLVDFRYKVVDPTKAAALTSPELKPALLDHTTGAKLIVPNSPKVGPMRQTVRQPVAGKTYFMLFANTRHHVKSGDKVTIDVGHARVENLTVE
jgi:hypothetical protein